MLHPLSLQRASIGYHLASGLAGGRAALATALFADSIGSRDRSFISCPAAVISIAAAALLPDYTNRDISQEYDSAESRRLDPYFPLAFVKCFSACAAK